MANRKERRAAQKVDRRVSERLQELGKSLDAQIEEMAGERLGFVLLVFSPVAGERMNYISNCPRPEMQNAMASLLKGWQSGMPDVPAHEVQG